MTSKKLIITGIITVGVLAGIVTCITMTGKEENVETVAEVQTAEEPETEVEQEEDGVLMGKGEGTALEDTEADKETATGTDDMASTTSEVFTEEEEAIVKQEVEQGLLEVPEDVSLMEMDTYLYTTTDVSLREKASVGSEKLMTVAVATKVHAVGKTEDGQWVKVEGVEEKDGFISAAYLQETVPTPEQKQANQQQKDEQDELNQQAQENQQQNQTVTNADAQKLLNDYMQSIGGGTGGRDVPVTEYVGGKNAGGILKAE